MTQRDCGGLRCSRCGCQHFRVRRTDSSRPNKIIRYRQCRHCGANHTSTERLNASPRDVQLQDG